MKDKYNKTIRTNLARRSNFIIILIVIVVTSCSLKRETLFQTREFEIYDFCYRHIDFNDSQCYYVKMKIPLNYVELLGSGGSVDKAQYFEYKDSSIIYISNEDFSWSENVDNINKLNDSIKENRLKSPLMATIIEEYKSNKRYDTPIIITQGVEEDGTYWKDIRYRCMCYGYRKVKEKNLHLFDDAINSFQEIKLDSISNQR